MCFFAMLILVKLFGRVVLLCHRPLVPTGFHLKNALATNLYDGGGGLLFVRLDVLCELLRYLRGKAACANVSRVHGQWSARE